MLTRKTFLCCTVVAAVGLLAASGAMASGYSCSTFAPTVTVAAGPCPVSSTSPTACEASGPYTGIKYSVTGSPDYIAALVTANNTVVSTGKLYAPCVGDPVTELGEQSCHEQAITFGCQTVTAAFWIVVQGQKGAVLQSVAVKRGGCVKSFAVAGLGFDVNPFQATQKVETVNFKGCAVKFTYDIVTGAVVSAAIDPAQSTKPVCAVGQNDGTCCAFNGGEDVSHLELTLNGQTLGTGQFGQGYVSSGTNSCTTRVVGGRVYTWGSPCP
jgi:hypothetical protein